MVDQEEQVQPLQDPYTPFIEKAIKRYQNDKDMTDEVLWETFIDDFKDYTIESFEAAKPGVVENLRRELRCRGIYTEKSKRTNKNKALVVTLAAEEQPEWPEQELLTIIDNGQEEWFSQSPYLTIRLRNLKKAKRGNSSRPTDRPNLDQPEKGKTLGLPKSKPSIEKTSPLDVDDELLELHDDDEFGRSNNSSRDTKKPSEEPERVRRTDAGKEIGSLIKHYKEEMKFGNAGDGFTLKLEIFYSVCRTYSVPEWAYADAFPNMLRGNAFTYYYNYLVKKKLPFDEVVKDMERRYEGESFRRNQLAKWESTSFKDTLAKHPDKSTSECFDILVTELQGIQTKLSENMQHDEFLITKLSNACRPVKECETASNSPFQLSNNLPTFIDNMKTAIATYESINGKQRPPESLLQQQHTVNMTERRYYSNRPRNTFTPNTRHPTLNRRTAGPDYRSKPKKRCFVCRKEGCWSNNHPQAEQNASKERFRKRNFNQIYNAYLAEYEGEEEDEEALQEEAFQAAEEAFNKAVLDEDDEEYEEEREPTTFFTSCGELPREEARELAANMANMACYHALTTLSLPRHDMLRSRYSSGKFHGICIDTGAATISSVGLGQYEAYNTIQPSPIDTKNLVNVKFGKGTTAASIGVVKINSPIGQVEFHVLRTDTPFLLCLGDMDKLKVHFNNLTNILHAPDGELRIIRRFGHPFLTWDVSPTNQSEDIFDCFLTETELRRLHRRFGHPSVERLQRVLERAGHDVDNAILKQLTKICHQCQKHGKAPIRFRFTLRDDVEFNSCVTGDIMYINGKPLLHVVDEATRYQAGRWLKDMSAKNLWEKFQECWINTYLGPPDWFIHDAGTNFMAKEFRQNAISQGTMLKDVPVEAHNSIGIIERYHAPVRRAYEIISAELPDLDRDAALQMAFKAVNDTAGPDGLIPTLLVYGAFPRMTVFDAPSATTSRRATTLKKAMAEVRALRAKRQVNDALNTRNGPSTSMVKDLAVGDPVMVWRKPNPNKAGHWEGPFPFWEFKDEECIVGHSKSKFRATMVKPYYEEQDTTSGHTLESPTRPSEPSDLQQEGQSEMEQEEQPNRSSGRLKARRPGTPEPPGTAPNQSPCASSASPPHAITLGEEIFEEIFILTPEGVKPFQQSRLTEANGLVERGVFKPVSIEEVPADMRIFNSRFVDEVRNEGSSDAYEKSRLVIQAYNDAGKVEVLTESPTIQRVSQRFILCLAVLLELGVYLRDMVQAYTQAKSNLARPIYARPPPDFDMWIDCILQVIKPLYGIPESGNHWFSTFHKHHLEKLMMKQSTFDPCLLSTNKGDPIGIAGLQTDDVLFAGNKEFAKAEDEAIRKEKFESKDQVEVTPTRPGKYNGTWITRQHDGPIYISQERHVKSIKMVEMTPATLTSSRGLSRLNMSTKDQYVAQRARGAYVATMTQPEASFDLSIAAQTTEPTEDDVKALNKRLQWQIDHSTRGLKFVKLDKDSLRLVAFTDGSFANLKDYSSQIGYVIALADKDNNANVLHWSSTKCKRVTRSVLASELYAMTSGFDMASCLKATLEGILHTPIPLVVCTDSKSLFDCLVKLGTTNEKRLMIDLMALRQSYERREIAEVKWIKGNTNPADAMTKAKPCNALEQLINTNRIKLEEMDWVER